MRKLLSAGLCLALLSGLYVIGQEDNPREGKGGKVRRATAVLGSTVSVKGGDSLGKVADMAINERGGIDYLIVQLDKGMVPVPWGAVNFNAEERTFTISGDFTRDRLKDITFTEKEWPDMRSEKWIRTATDVWGERAIRRDFRPEEFKDRRRDDVRKDDVKDARPDNPRKDAVRPPVETKDVRPETPRKDDVRPPDRRPDDVRPPDRRPDLPPDRPRPPDRPPQ